MSRHATQIVARPDSAQQAQAALPVPDAAMNATMAQGRAASPLTLAMPHTSCCSTSCTAEWEAHPATVCPWTYAATNQGFNNRQGNLHCYSVRLCRRHWSASGGPAIHLAFAKAQTTSPRHKQGRNNQPRGSIHATVAYGNSVNSNTDTYTPALATLMTQVCHPIGKQHRQQPQLLDGAQQGAARQRPCRHCGQRGSYCWPCGK
jgi:hypothetical protein